MGLFEKGCDHDTWDLRPLNWQHEMDVLRSRLCNANTASEVNKRELDRVRGELFNVRNTLRRVENDRDAAYRARDQARSALAERESPTITVHPKCDAGDLRLRKGDVGSLTWTFDVT